jgi:hypothetical protein
MDNIRDIGRTPEHMRMEAGPALPLELTEAYVCTNDTPGDVFSELIFDLMMPCGHRAIDHASDELLQSERVALMTTMIWSHN